MYQLKTYKLKNVQYENQTQFSSNSYSTISHDNPNRLIYLVKYAWFLEKYSFPNKTVCSFYIEAYIELRKHPEKLHTYNLEQLAVVIDSFGGKVPADEMS